MAKNILLRCFFFAVMTQQKKNTRMAAPKLKIPPLEVVMNKAVTITTERNKYKSVLLASAEENQMILSLILFIRGNDDDIIFAAK